MNVNTDALLHKIVGKKFSFLIDYSKQGMTLEEALSDYEKREEAKKELRRQQARDRYLQKKWQDMYGDDEEDTEVAEEVDEDDFYSGLYDEEDEADEVESYEYIPLEDEKPSKEEFTEAATRLQSLNAGMLEYIALAILKRSLYYCPIKTGRLRSSARLIKVGQGYAIRYYEDYAVYVHEWGYRHDSPTQRKFLEDAAYETFNNLRVTEPNIILPSVRLLLDPLTLYINVNTSQGYELFDDDWLDGDEHATGPFEMLSNYLNADGEYLTNLLENFEDLDRSTKLSEDVADMFTALSWQRYREWFRRGR